MEKWKYTNIHVEKYKRGKCKRVCGERKIYIYIYIKTSKLSNIQ